MSGEAFKALGVVDTIEMKCAQLAVALRQRHWELAAQLADDIRAESGDLLGYARKLRAYAEPACVGPSLPCSCAGCEAELQESRMRHEREAFSMVAMAAARR